MGVGARQIVIAFVVIGLFAFAAISFGVNYQQEWNSNQSILDDSRISSIYGGVNSTFKTSSVTVNDSSDTLYEESPKESGTVANLLFGGIVGIARGFTGIASQFFNAIFGPLLSLLGLNGELAIVVGAVLSTILGITLAFLVWRLLRRGD